MASIMVSLALLAGARRIAVGQQIRRGKS